MAFVLFLLSALAEWFGFMLRVPAIGINPNLSEVKQVGVAHTVINGKAVAVPFTADCTDQFDNPNYLTVEGVWYQLERMGINPISVEIKRGNRRLLFKKNNFFPVLAESW